MRFLWRPFSICRFVALMFVRTDRLAWLAHGSSENQGVDLCEEAEQDLLGDHPQEPSTSTNLL